MARIRTLKPEFWTDPDVVACSFAARLFFIGCWNHADDYGVLKDEPDRIRLQVFPADEVDAHGIVAELVKRRLLVRMVTPEGVNVLVIRTFRLHQKIDNRASPKYGDPAEFTENTEESHPIPPSPTPVMEGKGEVREGIEPLCPPGGVRGSSSRLGRPPRATTDPDFDRFYAAFPRRKKPLDARKAWDQAVKLADPEAIIAGARRVKVPASGLNYVPYPATWLRAGGWLDEDQPDGPTTVTDRNRQAMVSHLNDRRPTFKERMAAASDLGSPQPQPALGDPS
jgi:hypothetical protein